jgi:putative transposase
VAFCAQCAKQLLHTVDRFQFELTAYCFMPDHVHLLLTGMSKQSMFLPCFHAWRQVTGYGWRRMSKTRLWQEGYWDHVLRTEDDVLQCAAYIIQNPVRSGLVARASEYPFIGSARFTIAQLEEVAVDAAYRSNHSTAHRGRG